jgi:small ligand-binding sensory domain FIST
VVEELQGSPSVAMLFVSGRHLSAVDAVVDAVNTLLRPEVLVGTTAVAVIAGSEELEREDAISLWAATGLPVQPFRLEALPGDPPILVGVPDDLEPGSMLVVLTDPSTLPVDVLVDQIDAEHPGVGVVGGLASAPGGSERNRIIWGSQVLLDGGAGFVLPPGMTSTVVSQGCRPIGSPWVITGVDGPLITELGGRPALERLTTAVGDLSLADRAVAARGLHAGIVADEHCARFEQGNFLIRGVLGADRITGAIAISRRAAVGQVLQFQLRDAASASAELHHLLSGTSGRSALVFTCNGRGTNLFDHPHHDALAVKERISGPVAGMFCSGELGPVAGHNAIHGFTATVLVFD